jgi:hypothetical protein
MKKLHFTAFAISLLVLLSCSDKPEKKNVSGSLLLVKMKSSEEGFKSKDIYKFNGSEYDLTDGEEKGFYITELSDGTVKNSKDDGWEKPDENKGEFAKWVIEKIDKNSVVLLFKSFTESIGKQNWRFNFKYKSGTYEDYLVGKTVELVPCPNEMERYDVSMGKGFIATMSLSGFDPENSKASFTTKPYVVQLNKEEIISTYENHANVELFVSSELHEEMLKRFKENSGD